MDLAVPEDVDRTYHCATHSRAFSLGGWEAALETVLEWLWTKHQLLVGQPRPASAYLNQDSRAAIAAFIDSLPTDKKRYRNCR